MRGLIIAVEPVDDPRRSLLIEYSYFRRPGGENFSYVMKPKASVQDLALRIEQALVAGWDPLSKGKPFYFEVPELCDETK